MTNRRTAALCRWTRLPAGRAQAAGSQAAHRPGAEPALDALGQWRTQWRTVPTAEAHLRGKPHPGQDSAAHQRIPPLTCKVEANTGRRHHGHTNGMELVQPFHQCLLH